MTLSIKILWDHFNTHYEDNEYVNGALSCADDNGITPLWVCKKLFKDHSSDVDEYESMGLPINNVLYVLEFLGY